MDLTEMFRTLNPDTPTNVIDAEIGFKLRRSIHEASKVLRDEPVRRDWDDLPPAA
jgi:hypothetical protein